MNNYYKSSYLVARSLLERNGWGNTCVTRVAAHIVAVFGLCGLVRERIRERHNKRRNHNPELIEKYKGKVLGETCYACKNDKIFADQFISRSGLLFFLHELDCRESVLTKDGLGFLREYYGLDAVADMVIEKIKDGVKYRFSENEKDEIIAWLENLGK